MKSGSQNQPVDLIACEICMKEIPASEAASEEATDYVIYFCGLDCYDAWRTKKEVEDDSPD